MTEHTQKLNCFYVSLKENSEILGKEWFDRSATFNGIKFVINLFHIEQRPNRIKKCHLNVRSNREWPKIRPVFMAHTKKNDENKTQHPMALSKTMLLRALYYSIRRHFISLWAAFFSVQFSCYGNLFEYICCWISQRRLIFVVCLFTCFTFFYRRYILQSICFCHCFMCHFLAILYIGIIIIALFTCASYTALLTTVTLPISCRESKKQKKKQRKGTENVGGICKIKIYDAKWTKNDGIKKKLAEKKENK